MCFSVLLCWGNMGHYGAMGRWDLPCGCPPKEVGSGATVPGFPNGGVATTLAEGRGFSWGDQPIVAAGKTYDLCWCNGTASGCLLLGWGSLWVGWA